MHMYSKWFRMFKYRGTFWRVMAAYKQHLTTCLKAPKVVYNSLHFGVFSEIPEMLDNLHLEHLRML